MNPLRAILSIALLALAAIAGAQSPVFTVLDERNEGDKKAKIMSLVITKCDYGIYRLGEKKAPGRFDALRADLESLESPGLAGKTLHVSRYDIYFNAAADLRRTTYNSHTGIIPELMSGMGVDCPREKTTGGWYDGAELTGPFSPIVVELRAALEGVEHEIRVVHTPAAAIGGTLKKPPEKAELTAAMRKTAELLASRLP